MAVGVITEFAATVEQYDAVNEKLNAAGEPPAGLIIHTAGVIGDAQMRVFEVWESEDAYQSFRAGRLVPAIEAVAGPDAPSPTSEQVYELHDVAQP